MHRGRIARPVAIVLAFWGAGTAAADTPPEGPVDFERHVMGVLGRMGCNAGSCHGSFQGKGGFRLSLFGYDPAKDHQALTRDGLGRRINPLDPDRSLLLLKATGQVEHGGGRRFEVGSWPHAALRAWIAAGGRREPGRGTVADLLIRPAEVRFRKAGESAGLRVVARFADGSEEDVTRYSDLRTQDDAVADVAAPAEVRAHRPGDTALIVAYRGTVRSARVLVPHERPAGTSYPDVESAGAIDRLVLAKLRDLNVVPSGPASDAEFIRRATIDTIGTLPSPEAVRAFLADTDPAKRGRKVDELLAHPRHAALWATKLSDVTGNNTDVLELPREKHSQMWHDWLRRRLAANQPYDQLVRDILLATSREGRPPGPWLDEFRTLEAAMERGFPGAYADRRTLDLFWRRQGNVPIEQWGEKVAAAFLGVRLECAQCHKHPFDRWTQEDYRAFANIFARVAYGTSPEAKKILDAENAERRQKVLKNNQRPPAIKEIFVADRARALPHPETNRPLAPRALGGPEIPDQGGADPREALFAWMTSPDNPLFARSFVNRVWGHYLGVGIVDPVDDFALANPPSNGPLLDALAADFVAHGYDLRHLERAILTSRTYGLASETNETNRHDKTNYSHAYVRPMMAEAVVDVLDEALGIAEDFGASARPGSRAIEVGASRVNNGNLAYAFRIFGRPPRAAACDCERARDPALPQALYLMGDSAVLAKLEAPRGRLRTLLASGRPDEEVFEELVLATLSRPTTEAERDLFAAHREAKGDRKAAFVDALWALINTREFILNH